MVISLLLLTNFSLSIMQSELDTSDPRQVGSGVRERERVARSLPPARALDITHPLNLSHPVFGTLVPSHQHTLRALLSNIGHEYYYAYSMSITGY